METHEALNSELECNKENYLAEDLVLLASYSFLILCSTG